MVRCGLCKKVIPKESLCLTANRTGGWHGFHICLKCLIPLLEAAKEQTKD